MFKIILLISLIFIISCTNKIDSIDYKKFNNSELRAIIDNDEAVKSNLAKKFYIDGLANQSKGLYAESIIDFYSAYELENSYYILFSIAKSLKEINRLDQALVYLEKVNKSNPNFIPALELTSEILFLNYDYKTAIEIQEKIHSLQPSKDKKIELAQLYEFYDIDKAINYYEQALEEEEFIYYAKSITKLYEEKKDTTKLLKILNIQYKQSKNNKIAQRIFNIYLNKKLYLDVIELTDILDSNVDFNSLKAYYLIFLNELIVNQDFDINNKEKYLTFLNKIDVRFAFECDIHILKYMVEYEFNLPKTGNKINNIKLTNSNKDSISINTDKFLKLILKNCNNESDIVSRLCFFLINKKDFSVLEKVLDSFNPIFGNDFRFKYVSSLYFYEVNQIEKSKELMLDAVKLNPTNVFLLTQLGLIFDRLEKVDSSDYYYESALKIDSNFTLANNNYAYSLSKRNKDIQRALRLSYKTILVDSLNSSYLDTYGWIQYQLGNYKIALEYIQKSLEIGDETAEIFDHLGDVYLKLEDINNAIKYYEKSLFIEENKNIKLKLENLKNG